VEPPPLGALDRGAELPLGLEEGDFGSEGTEGTEGSLFWTCGGTGGTCLVTPSTVPPT
jgi:hypothetical protein